MHGGVPMPNVRSAKTAGQVNDWRAARLAVPVRRAPGIAGQHGSWAGGECCKCEQAADWCLALGPWLTVRPACLEQEGHAGGTAVAHQEPSVPAGHLQRHR
jgi:hypothetical protein